MLVKRKDFEDVNAKWVTLFSIPVTQASDMNFTVVDFYNAYGTTYVYAIVPVFLQTQIISGEPVQVDRKSVV